MAKKIIRMHLTEHSIDRAIDQLEQYKQTLEYKADLLERRLAERIRDLSQDGFDNSLVDDVLNGEPHMANVTVEPPTKRGDVRVIIAKGEDAIWVEFGAGVFWNGPAGSSPNPNGIKMGFTIGSYGKGRGKQAMWKFKDHDTGEALWSRGTEATMPMYHAMREVESEIYEIAREVFR